MLDRIGELIGLSDHLDQVAIAPITESISTANRLANYAIEGPCSTWNIVGTTSEPKLFHVEQKPAHTPPGESQTENLSRKSANLSPKSQEFSTAALFSRRYRLLR
jgi:hypothetical protein